MDIATQDVMISGVRPGTMIQMSLNGGKTWGSSFPIVEVKHSYAEYYQRPCVYVRARWTSNGLLSFGFHAGELGVRVRVAE
jgi:hypothetical protein